MNRHLRRVHPLRKWQGSYLWHSAHKVDSATHGR
jgi:hypothetical protein